MFFSASSPPYTSVVSIHAIDILDKDSSILRNLRKNVEFVHQLLTDDPQQLFLVRKNNGFTPIIHLQFAKPSESRYEDEDRLQAVVDKCLDHGLMITRAKYVSQEINLPAPSIRLCISAAHTTDHLKFALRTIYSAAQEIISQKL